MKDSIYCPMIHGGLNIDIKNSTNKLTYNQCCLSTNSLNLSDESTVDWNHENLQQLREKNNRNEWHPECWQCERLEKAGSRSFRQAMIDKFGVKQNLTGPQRIDLLFDRNCNLACRICGPHSSTFWTKHLKDNNLYTASFPATDNLFKIEQMLRNLDLTNLEMVQFCGGETLMGNTYWHTANLLSKLVPDAKNRLQLVFQTNGTQPIDPKYFDIIEKFKLVKLMISMDCTQNRFEYLRWPADWNQVANNILELRQSLPSNVMFMVQETISCLNLFYFDEVSTWVSKNFNSNREGDVVNYSAQLASHEYLDVRHITQEYANALAGTKQIHTIGDNWKENPKAIKRFITQTEKFDALRGQDWKKTFPDIVDFYSRYL